MRGLSLLGRADTALYRVGYGRAGGRGSKKTPDSIMTITQARADPVVQNGGAFTSVVGPDGTIPLVNSPVDFYGTPHAPPGWTYEGYGPPPYPTAFCAPLI